MAKISAFSIIRSSIATLFANKVIFFPFCIIAFLQLLVLEIIYFIPRYPLKDILGPVLVTFHQKDLVNPEVLLHYPAHLFTLPRDFQAVQIPLFIFVLSFFIGVAVNLIAKINAGKKIQMGEVVKETLPFYVHIVLAIALSYSLRFGLFKVLGALYIRASEIRSDSGNYYILKRIVMDGLPYYKLLVEIFITTLFAYVIPIIVIDKKKVFAALALNFKNLFGSFWHTFTIVFIPSLLYSIVLLLSGSISSENFFPEFNLVILLLSIIAVFFINTLVYTGITMYFLIQKENK